jgi:hypothetical protein
MGIHHHRIAWLYAAEEATADPFGEAPGGGFGGAILLAFSF